MQRGVVVDDIGIARTQRQVELQVGALAEVGLDAPVDVGQGEGSLDEMCLTGIGVSVKAP